MPAGKSVFGFWAPLLLLIVTVLLMTDTLTPLLYGNPQDLTRNDTTDSNPIKLVVSIVFLGATFGLLLWRPHLALKLLIPGWIVVLLALLPVLSTAWSLDKATTLKRAAAHVLTITFCYYVVTTWRPETFLRVLFCVLVFGCGISDVAAVALPSLGVNHDILSGNIGAWVGVYADKIMSGAVSAVTLLLAIVIPARNGWQHLFKWAAFPAAGALCAMSQSRTAWVVVALGLVMIGFAALLSLPKVSKSLKLGVTATLAVVFGGGLIASIPILLPILGRTATFSGRTNLWHGAIAVAEARHPLVGSGYRAFWTDVNAAPVRNYIAYWERLVGNAHNGYLDAWLEMGWIGAFVLGLFLILTLVGLVDRMLNQPRAWRWRALFVVVLTFVLTNAAFTLAFKHSQMFWAGCVIAFLYVVRSRMEERWAKAAAAPRAAPVIRVPRERALVAARAAAR